MLLPTQVLAHLLLKIVHMLHNTTYWTLRKGQHLFAHVDEPISAVESTKTGIHTNYP